MQKPEVPMKVPCAVDVEQGKTYWWCACGRSTSQPFCDGSHQGSDFSPVQYVAEENKKVHFCGCKQTQRPPLCDGSHKSL